MKIKNKTLLRKTIKQLEKDYAGKKIAIYEDGSWEVIDGRIAKKDDAELFTISYFLYHFQIRGEARNKEDAISMAFKEIEY